MNNSIPKMLKNGNFAKFFKKTLFLKAREAKFHKILMFFSKKLNIAKTDYNKKQQKTIKSYRIQPKIKEVVWTFKLQFKTVWNG